MSIQDFSEYYNYYNYNTFQPIARLSTKIKMHVNAFYCKYFVAVNHPLLC